MIYLTTNDLLIHDDDDLKRWFVLSQPITLVVDSNHKLGVAAFPPLWYALAQRIEVRDDNGKTIAVLKDREGITYDLRP